MTTDIDYSGTVPTDVTTVPAPMPQQSYPVDHWLTRDEAKALIRLVAAQRHLLTTLMRQVSGEIAGHTAARWWNETADKSDKAVVDLGPLWTEAFKTEEK